MAPMRVPSPAHGDEDYTENSSRSEGPRDVVAVEETGCILLMMFS